MSPIISGGSSGGSASPAATNLTSTQTANRASGFQASHVFDLGGPTVFYAKCTATVLTPDGETIANAPGGITFGDAFLNGTVQISLDNATWLDVATSKFVDITAAGDIIAVNAFRDGWGSTPRYVKIGHQVEDWNSGNPYAGANNPVFTGRYDLRALVLT